MIVMMSSLEMIGINIAAISWLPPLISQLLHFGRPHPFHSLAVLNIDITSLFLKSLQPNCRTPAV